LAVALHSAFGLALIGYEWFIARVALRAGGLVATAVVLLDLVVGIGVDALAQGLY
jgi:hypothetical protein